MRLLSIGRPLAHRNIDNASIFSAPALFDYEAIAIDPNGVFRTIREVLDARAEHHTLSELPVHAGQSAPGSEGLGELLRRRRDELAQALERGALVVVFAFPQAQIVDVPGFDGLDRYFFLPAPAGLAWNAELVRWGEGTSAAITEERHPFASYVDAIRHDLLYRAYFDDRARGFADHARVFARSGGGAAIGVEFSVLGGTVVFLPATKSVGGDAGRAQAGAIMGAALELFGRTPDDPPSWLGSQPVPGLDEREAAVATAEEQLRRAEDQLAAARSEADPLHRVRDVLWTEGQHALLPAAVRCLELLGYRTQASEDGAWSARADGVRLDVEAEGSTDVVGMAPHYRLRARLDARIEEEGRAPRGLIVANGLRLTEPRQRKTTYADALRVAAEATSYALLPAPELFAAARAALAGADDNALKAIRERIATTNGLVALGDLLGEGAS